MNSIGIIQTPLMVFMNLCVIVMIFLLMKKSLHYPYRVKSINRYISICLIFLFVLFSFWGVDWFHYLKLFISIKDGFVYHLEDVYVWIIQNLSINYIVFRLIIWGSGIVLFLLLISRLPINKDLAIFVFGCVWMIWFSYARVSLCMVMAFLGFTLLNKPYKMNVLSYIFGLCLIVCSVIFHRTAIFGIGVGFLAYCAEKINRRLYIFLLLVFIVFFIVYIKIFIEEFLSFEIKNEDAVLGEVVEKGQFYMNKEATGVFKGKGLGPSIMILFEIVPYYLIAWLCYKVQLSTQYKKIPTSISFFIRLQLLIVIVSSLFLLDWGISISSIYIRFLRFSIIPNVVVLSYFLMNRFYLKLAKNILVIAVLGCFYAVIYNMYCAAIRGQFF